MCLVDFDLWLDGSRDQEPERHLGSQVRCVLMAPITPFLIEILISIGTGLAYGSVFTVL